MMTQPKKKKNKFNFDNMLSYNRNFDLSDNNENDKWFSYISKQTNMLYEPENENHWSRCKYCVLINQVEYKIVLWYSRSSGLHFDFESEKISFRHEFATYCVKTPLLNVSEFFHYSTVEEFVAELNKVIKSLKQFQIQKKKQYIEMDFRNDI